MGLSPITIRRSTRAGWYALCSIVSLAFILPVAWALLAAFRTREDTFSNLFPLSWNTFLPSEWTLVNFERLLIGTEWPRYISNTVIVALTTVVLGTLVNSLAAYALARLKPKGSAVIFAVILGIAIMPFEAVAFPMYLVARNLGILETLQGLILPWIANAFSIFLLRQFFLEIPGDLEDAARCDGANWWQVYVRVIVPITWPAHISVALITFQQSWDSFLWPLIAATGENARVLQVAIASLVSLEATDWERMFSAISIAAFIPIVLFLLLQRYYLRGMTMSGIK